VSAEGALLFARYAYPPNALGYCGPDGAAALLRADATAEIERRARQFEGAWSYLEFIAESAGIPDPLDQRVVQAYWIGNDLLDTVEPAALLDRLLHRFRSQTRGSWRTASERAVAHHSFQVFDVYPWAGLLAATGNATALDVLDRCRIRTGVVVRVDGPAATVRSRPLVWDGTSMAPGPQRQEVVHWSHDGRALIGAPDPGDRVALHWDWLCEVLTAEQVRTVEWLETRQRAYLTAIRPRVA
jgi:hypothetical protein